MKLVIFTSVHGAGRSQIAAALFNDLCNSSEVHAMAAGSSPGKCVHPEVVHVMSEIGIDLFFEKPRRLDEELSSQASVLVSMGFEDDPPGVSGQERLQWYFTSPQGKSRTEVVRIRESIRSVVEMFLIQRGWINPFRLLSRPPASAVACAV